MKLSDEVKKIFEKYPWKLIQLPDEYKNIYRYVEKNPEINEKYVTEKSDGILYDKYRKNIPRGWYGFSIGTPVHPEWIEIIDETLELCIKNDPDFEIYQIKVKFGGIRFYVGSNVIEDVWEIEMLFNTLHDPALIY